MKNEKVNNQENDGVVEINLARIAVMLWRKLWIIVLAGILAASAGFSYAKFMIDPLYSSSVTMYVNNSSVKFNDVSLSISSTELFAAQSLVKTYIAILKNRDSLELVLERAGSNYSWSQLMGMIDASPVDETEIFRVTVTTTDPYESQRLANAISEILPERVRDIIDGSSMRLVSSARVEPNRVSPSITRYTTIGLAAGVVLACAVLIILDLLNDEIRDEKYIIQTFGLPVLARVPDMLAEHSNRYGYYNKYSRYGKYGKYGSNPYDNESDS